LLFLSKIDTFNYCIFVNNINSFNLYNSFVKEFELSKNAKKKKKSNSINTKIENFINIVKKNNNR